jgi:hypothetical protein
MELFAAGGCRRGGRCLFARIKPNDAASPVAEIHPGEVWPDTDGKPIDAHGGGILHHEGTYY